MLGEDDFGNYDDRFNDDEGSVTMIDHTGAHNLEKRGTAWVKTGRVDVTVRKTKGKSKATVRAERERALFYVGSKDIARSVVKGTDGRPIHDVWPITSEAEAIEKARKICADTGLPQIVVKIVAVIEPAERPITVTRI